MRLKAKTHDLSRWSASLRGLVFAGALFLFNEQLAGSPASSAAKPRVPSAAQQSSTPEAIDKKPPGLNRGKPVAGGLAGDQTQRYRVKLDVGEYLRVMVEQRGVDVTLRVWGPDGRLVLEVNHQAGAQGTETMSLVAEVKGDYLVEVRAAEALAKPGAYRIEIAEQRRATAEDRNRVAAKRATRSSSRESLGLPQPLERELKGGEAHEFPLTLAAGQYLQLVVEQRGIDVVVAISGPDGKKLAEVDSPNGTQGPEPVSLAPEASGSYQIEVRSLEKNAAAGHYEVRVQELRAATARDKRRVMAQQTFLAAERLRNQGRREAWRSAIEKYEEALSHWRAADDIAGQAAVLNNIGVCQISLGEYQKAKDSLEQALALRRTANDRRGEAETLYQLGRAFYFSEDKARALDYYN